MTAPKINTHYSKDINEYDRTSSDILKITEDKLKLKLELLERSVESKSNLFCFIGIIFTLLVTLLTADFKDFLSITKEVWKAIFMVIFIMMFFLIIKEGYCFWKNHKTKEEIINDIKNSDS